jgi:hypothetical protein
LCLQPPILVDDCADQPEPPTATPNANLTLPDPYIPSLNARVIALRFYESGNEVLPFEQRVYKQSFASQTSRHIHWELHLRHPAPGRRVDFSVIAIYYRINASMWEEIGRKTDYTYVEADWTGSYHASGYGCDDPENCWEIGTYRIDLYVEGKKIASKQFHTYTLSELSTPPPTATPTPEPPTATPNANLTLPDPYIPSLNARVIALRFYESGNEDLPREEIVYQQRFASDTTRYINWELDLEYPAPGRRTEFEITAIWYQDKGTSSWEEIYRRTRVAYVEADWTGSYHASGYGCDDPENCWEIGTYRIDLYVEGKKIASEQFHIYTPSEPSTPPPTTTSTSVDIATALAPLEDTLVRVFHFNNSTKEWTFFDTRPEFVFASTLSELVPGQSYCIRLDQDQTVTLEGVTYSLFAGWNLVTWNTGEASYLGEGNTGREACETTSIS